jgi:hypothetical protein
MLPWRSFCFSFFLLVGAAGRCVELTGRTRGGRPSLTRFVRIVRGGYNLGISFHGKTVPPTRFAAATKLVSV